MKIKAGKKPMDVTPSPEGYKNMLIMVRDNAEHKENRDWATSELKRIQPDGKLVKKWGKQ